MRKLPWIVTACLVFVLAPSIPSSADVPGEIPAEDVASTLEAPSFSPAVEPSVSRIIVKLKLGNRPTNRLIPNDETLAPNEADKAAETATVRLIEKTPELDGAEVADEAGSGDGSSIVTLAEPVSATDAVALSDELELRADVEWAEPDYRLFAADVSPYPVQDSRFSEQWSVWDAVGANGRYSIKAPDAWTRTRGSKSVVVAVVDTGITRHPELDDNRVAGYDMIADRATANDGDGRDSNSDDPGDWINRSNRPADCDPATPNEDSSWHGTHVAGIIAAQQNSVGTTGIAPNVRVQSVRALGVCGGYTSDIAAAIRWAAGGSVPGVAKINATPAKVINVSLGGGGMCGSAMQSAINFAGSKGAIVVVAAGNSSRAAAYSTPANCANSFVVTATGRNGQQSWYSNYGVTSSPVDIAAPGGNPKPARNPYKGAVRQVDQDSGILSTYNSGKTKPVTPSTAYMSGTSMATPEVSAAAALMFSAANISPSEVMSRLKSTAQAFPETGTRYKCTKTTCGAGILDVGAAVNGLFTAPANDDISLAENLQGNGGKVAGTTVGATRSTGEPAITANTGGASVWFKYTAPSTGKFTASTSGSSFNTMLGLYGADMTKLAGSDNAPAGRLTSQVTSIPMVKGETYYLAIDGNRPSGGLPAVGAYTLSWQLQFFSDVAPDHPFFTEIEWLAVEKISLGNDDGSFTPSTSITRQAMAAFLYRMDHDGADAPPCAAASRFPDVAVGNRFCGAIEWLADSGITTGYSSGKFRPVGLVSRDAMAAYMYRYYQSKLVSPAADLDCDRAKKRKFKDVPDNHPFCGVIEWAADNNITNGYGAGKYQPASNVSRSGVAAFLFRLAPQLTTS